MAPVMLNFSSKWGRVVSFTAVDAAPSGKATTVPTDWEAEWTPESLWLL